MHPEVEKSRVNYSIVNGPPEAELWGIHELWRAWTNKSEATDCSLGREDDIAGLTDLVANAWQTRFKEAVSAVELKAVIDISRARKGQTSGRQLFVFCPVTVTNAEATFLNQGSYSMLPPLTRHTPTPSGWPRWRQCY
jgi:hypothetical protein